MELCDLRVSTRLDVGSWSFPLAYHPEIARNNIRNPSNVTGKWLIGFALFLQRHYKQIRVHRLNKIRGYQTSIATDAAGFDRDFGRSPLHPWQYRSEEHPS